MEKQYLHGAAALRIHPVLLFLLKKSITFIANMIMNSQELPPVMSSQKRYGSSIPSGRISQFAPTEVPMISKRGTSRGSNPISMHELTDPSLIDQKLKSLSHTSLSESDMRISLEV
jgi:hypothetical protein